MDGIKADVWAFWDEYLYFLGTMNDVFKLDEQGCLHMTMSYSLDVVTTFFHVYDTRVFDGVVGKRKQRAFLQPIRVSAISGIIGLFSQWK